MKNLIFCFLLIFQFSNCDKSTLEISIDHPVCIEEKVNEFSQQEKSRSVEWNQSDNQVVYKFRSLEKEFYLNENCDTLCQYALISSFLPPCKFELDNDANWQPLW
jgi:hypothetical protein